MLIKVIQPFYQLSDIKDSQLRIKNFLCTPREKQNNQQKKIFPYSQKKIKNFRNQPINKSYSSLIQFLFIYIQSSNTLYLYTKGWNGLNMEASTNRYHNFLALRPQDLNLNYAVAKNTSYVTLYDVPGAQVYSTINEGVKQTIQKKNWKISPVSVPGITMKQICQKFYSKKPNFLSLDVQGFSSFALLQNDWSNPICRPQIIFCEVNHSFNDKEIKSPQKILEQNGYQFHSQIQFSQIFIQKTVASKYFKKFQQGTAILAQRKIIKTMEVINALYSQLFKRTKSESYLMNDQKEPSHFYFPKEGTFINLQNINRHSNKFCSVLNRPIVIIYYNSSNTVFVQKKKTLKVQQFSIGGFNFFNLTITKNDGTNFTTYVYTKKINISYFSESDQFNTGQLTKEIVKIQNSISELNNIESKSLNSIIEALKKQLSSYPIELKNINNSIFGLITQESKSLNSVVEALKKQLNSYPVELKSIKTSIEVLSFQSKQSKFQFYSTVIVIFLTIISVLISFTILQRLKSFRQNFLDQYKNKTKRRDQFMNLSQNQSDK